MRNVVGSVAVAVVLVLGARSASAEDAKPAPTPQKTAAPAKPAKRAASRTDVAVGAALARCDDGLVMQGPGPSAGATGGAATPAPSAIVEARGDRGLADISVAQKQSSDTAGTAQDVQLTAVAPGTKVARPVATVRMQRKMNVDRVVASMGAAFEGCRALAGVGANGSVAVQLDINPAGQVERVEFAGVRGPVAKPAVACVLTAFNHAQFGAPGPQGATLTVPVALVQDRGDVTRVATSD